MCGHPLCKHTRIYNWCCAADCQVLCRSLCLARLTFPSSLLWKRIGANSARSSIPAAHTHPQAALTHARTHARTLAHIVFAHKSVRTGAHAAMHAHKRTRTRTHSPYTRARACIYVGDASELRRKTPDLPACSLIRDVRPDSVMIELCPKRMDQMLRKMAAAGKPTDSSEADVASLIARGGFVADMFKDRIK